MKRKQLCGSLKMGWLDRPSHNTDICNGQKFTNLATGFYLIMYEAVLTISVRVRADPSGL